ncbi:unnamed protein product [Amoebophrya sp. A25]|nr:unnamed protein product [Amoebophrya sp. A25]|eukprot:GSA25T00018006001.1
MNNEDSSWTVRRWARQPVRYAPHSNSRDPERAAWVCQRFTIPSKIVLGTTTGDKNQVHDRAQPPTAASASSNSSSSSSSTALALVVNNSEQQNTRDTNSNVLPSFNVWSNRAGERTVKLLQKEEENGNYAVGTTRTDIVVLDVGDSGGSLLQNDAEDGQPQRPDRTHEIQELKISTSTSSTTGGAFSTSNVFGRQRMQILATEEEQEELDDEDLEDGFGNQSLLEGGGAHSTHQPGASASSSQPGPGQKRAPNTSSSLQIESQMNDFLNPPKVVFFENQQELPCQKQDSNISSRLSTTSSTTRAEQQDINVCIPTGEYSYTTHAIDKTMYKDLLVMLPGLNYTPEYEKLLPAWLALRPSRPDEVYATEGRNKAAASKDSKIVGGDGNASSIIGVGGTGRGPTAVGGRGASTTASGGDIASAGIMPKNPKAIHQMMRELIQPVEPYLLSQMGETITPILECEQRPWTEMLWQEIEDFTTGSAGDLRDDDDVDAASRCTRRSTTCTRSSSVIRNLACFPDLVSCSSSCRSGGGADTSSLPFFFEEWMQNRAYCSGIEPLPANVKDVVVFGGSCTRREGGSTRGDRRFSSLEDENKEDELEASPSSKSGKASKSTSKNKSPAAKAKASSSTSAASKKAAKAKAKSKAPATTSKWSKGAATKIRIKSAFELARDRINCRVAEILSPFAIDDAKEELDDLRRRTKHHEDIEDDKKPLGGCPASTSTRKRTRTSSSLDEMQQIEQQTNGFRHLNPMQRYRECCLDQVSVDGRVPRDPFVLHLQSRWAAENAILFHSLCPDLVKLHGGGLLHQEDSHVVMSEGGEAAASSYRNRSPHSTSTWSALQKQAAGSPTSCSAKSQRTWRWFVNYYSWILQVLRPAEGTQLHHYFHVRILEALLQLAQFREAKNWILTNALLGAAAADEELALFAAHGEEVEGSINEDEGSMDASIDEEDLILEEDAVDASGPKNKGSASIPKNLKRITSRTSGDHKKNEDNYNKHKSTKNDEETNIEGIGSKTSKKRRLHLAGTSSTSSAVLPTARASGGGGAVSSSTAARRGRGRPSRDELQARSPLALDFFVYDLLLRIGRPELFYGGVRGHHDDFAHRDVDARIQYLLRELDRPIRARQKTHNNQVLFTRLSIYKILVYWRRPSTQTAATGTPAGGNHGGGYGATTRNTTTSPVISVAKWCGQQWLAALCQISETLPDEMRFEYFKRSDIKPFIHSTTSSSTTSASASVLVAAGAGERREATTSTSTLTSTTGNINLNFSILNPNPLFAEANAAYTRGSSVSPSSLSGIRLMLSTAISLINQSCKAGKPSPLLIEYVWEGLRQKLVVAGSTPGQTLESYLTLCAEHVRAHMRWRREQKIRVVEQEQKIHRDGALEDVEVEVENLQEDDLLQDDDCQDEDEGDKKPTASAKGRGTSASSSSKVKDSAKASKASSAKAAKVKATAKAKSKAKAKAKAGTVVKKSGKEKDAVKAPPPAPRRTEVRIPLQKSDLGQLFCSLFKCLLAGDSTVVWLWIFDLLTSYPDIFLPAFRVTTERRYQNEVEEEDLSILEMVAEMIGHTGDLHYVRAKFKENCFIHDHQDQTPFRLSSTTTISSPSTTNKNSTNKNSTTTANGDKVVFAKMLVLASLGPTFRNEEEPAPPVESGSSIPRGLSVWDSILAETTSSTTPSRSRLTSGRRAQVASNIERRADHDQVVQGDLDQDPRDRQAPTTTTTTTTLVSSSSSRFLANFVEAQKPILQRVLVPKTSVSIFGSTNEEKNRNTLEVLQKVWRLILERDRKLWGTSLSQIAQQIEFVQQLEGNNNRVLDVEDPLDLLKPAVPKNRRRTS